MRALRAMLVSKKAVMNRDALHVSTLLHLGMGIYMLGPGLLR